MSACRTIAAFPDDEVVTTIVPVPDTRADDRELTARLKAGDPAALAQLYDLYAPMVYGAARRVLGDEGMAEDVTQEVFTFVWQQPQRFDASRGSLRSWLGMLAHHRSVDRVRVEERRSWREAHWDAVVPNTTEGSDVDDGVMRDWLATCVRGALDRLPAEQRAVLVLAYFGGRSYKQVAAELAIPEGTAKSRVRMALAKLEDLLAPALIDSEAPAWM